jgi:carbamoyltransferase
MIVLSFISWRGVHDTAAAIVCDGELVAAAEQERFSRVKHDAAVPLDAIDYCLQAAGIDMSGVDLLVVPEHPYRTGRGSKLAATPTATMRSIHRAGEARLRSVFHHHALHAWLRLGLPFPPRGFDEVVGAALAAVRERYGMLPPLRFYDHHETHAAATFLTSGLAEAAVATVDGRGDPFSTVIWRAGPAGLSRIQAEPWTNSLGFFFRDCTRYLGFGDFGEGKAMGLASYGDPSTLADQVGELLELPAAGDWYRYVRPPAPSELEFSPRDGEDPLRPPWPDFAAAAQTRLEAAIERIVASARGEADNQELCLAGGVTLNCAANGRIAATSPRMPWLFAAAGDAGLPVGACLLAALEAGDIGSSRRLDVAALGPAFGVAEIRRAAERSGLMVEEPRDLATDVAERLARGDVVGWFQGRMELGPRALGQRSILADPRSIDVRDRVNRLKGREAWRPLAPVVTAEAAGRFFELGGESPFMLIAASVRMHARAALAGVVHVDGTARPQTVRPGQNPLLYAVLSAFEQRTGLPVVINTSFNAAGEPIVCTPDDAIRTFRAIGLDALALGPLVLTHPGRPVTN